MGILPTGEDFLKTSNLMNNDNTSRRVYLVRHGITDWIEQGILQGISDRPLSPFGTEQAELTARAFQGIRAAHLYTSPLLRAVQTAQPIARVTGLTPEAIEGFTEMDYGWMEGKKDVWSLVKQSTFLVNIYHASLRMAGRLSGESPDKFKARILDAWENLRNGSRGQTLILVAHFNVLRYILMHEFGENDENARRFSLSACSISEIEINGHSPSRIMRINDVSHLNGRVQD